LTGGALPAALLCAALGLALGFADRRAWAPSLLALVFAALAATLLPLGAAGRAPFLLGCWFSLLLAAVAVHLPQGVGLRLALLLAANAGFWSGGVIQLTAQPVHLLVALPWALLCLPAGWIVSRERGIVLKVLVSWLAAVALLAAALPTISTPASEPDHMD
jgi:hypothetical protein